MTMQLFTGKQYLKIDIANSFGLDRKDWDERIAWFDENEPNLLNLLKEAKEPAMFFAGICAWNDVTKGKPSSYPISLDSTASGIQILSVAICCRTSALACNVVDSGKREDAYTNQYHEMCEQAGTSAKLDRKLTKQALMTAMYCSTAVPEEVFGEGTKMLALFYKVVNELMPGAWKLNQQIKDCWQPDALSHDWVLPDNFHVKIKVMKQLREEFAAMGNVHTLVRMVNQSLKESRSLPANIVHSIDGFLVRELIRRCNFNPKVIQAVIDALNSTHKGTSTKDDKMVMLLWQNYQYTGFLSARILDHLNRSNMGHVDAAEITKLINSLPKKPFKVLSVHDCFRVLPNYGNDLRKQYNLLMSNLARSNILSDIITQITGRQVTVNKMDDIADEILESNYSLS